LTCDAAARRLQAFHDQELPVRDQIAVSAHLEACASCSSALAELRDVRSALLAAVKSRERLSNEEAAAFGAGVVNRLKAEQEASLLARLRGMFDDIRLVYAGVGAAAATVMCVVVMLGMMRFATNERPDSLAAIVNLLSTSIDCETGAELADVSGCRERWEGRFQRANELDEQESVFKLDAVLTHQGRLTTLETLHASRLNADGHAQIVEGLLDSVSRLRLEGVPPVRPPVTVNMLWMVEHATVRGKQPALTDPLTPKKRAASGSTPSLSSMIWT
jgi:hypothetical protein